ncbi:hypothetical protein [Streptomyces sp. PvR034]|uniref:hypothetical protein n=1 Tax=Streptomyces sp. PvR034 TaxID=3156401 RepID=UPI003398C886
MGTIHSSPPIPGTGPGSGATTGKGPHAGHGPDSGTAAGPRTLLLRSLPALAAVAVFVAALLASDTSLGDIGRYAFYVLWGVLLPGTLVYRSLRRRPHTLVEDLAFGAVTGLALELAAWAVFMALGLQSAVTLWPLAVVIPFALVPRLRRHWRVRGYTPVPMGWSWSIAATVAATTGYLYRVYMDRNPVLPLTDQTRQFVDVSYQMSLAGNAKHNFPLTLPQVSGEPLEYHWFAFVHEAMTSMVGHIDLPVVQLRLMIPALVALTVVITAVVAWRLSGKAWAGPVAALLIFLVGEFNGGPAWTPFGSPQTTLMVWASISMTYSIPLLLALIGVVGEGLRERSADDPVPALGRTAVVTLVALFAVASCAAKATSVPVTLAGLALAGLVVLVRTRRIPWLIVVMGGAVGAAQLFSTAVIFNFKSYGLEVAPLSNIQALWADPMDLRSGLGQFVLVALVWFAFLLNTQLRLVGALPLLWRGKLKLDSVQWFLLGGTIAGPAVYLLLNGWNSSYFTHAGLAFGVLLSGWGYAEAFERAKLSARGRWALAAASALFTLALVWVFVVHGPGWEHRVTHAISTRNPGADSLLGAFATSATGMGPAAALAPMVAAGLVLVLLAAVGALLWWLAARRFTSLRQRGTVVLLSAALLAGAPTLVWDLRTPKWDATVWGSFPLPAGKIEAARWLRAHSDPSDVVATNEHCWSPDDFKDPEASCTDYRTFAVSGYSERSVLVEGWAFAPRVMAAGTPEFWDQDLLKKNDAAFYVPTPALLNELRDRHGVRFLFVNRKAGAESGGLAKLADRVFDNDRIAIYKIR